MAKRKQSAERIIRMLKQAEVGSGQGKTIKVICRALVISERIMRWECTVHWFVMRECGGMRRLFRAGMYRK